MTPLEFQGWMGKVGLPSLRQAARALGVHRNTMTKYIRDGVDSRTVILAMKGYEAELAEQEERDEDPDPAREGVEKRALRSGLVQGRYPKR